MISLPRSESPSLDILVLPNPARVQTMVLWLVVVAVGIFVAIRQSSLGSKAVGRIFAAVALFGCVQMWCSAIRCDRGGITRDDGFRTRKVLWSDVEKFELRGGDGIGVRLNSEQLDAIDC